MSRELLERVLTARRVIAEQMRSIAWDDGGLFDPQDSGPPWYLGPGEHDVFWPKLRTTLEGDPGWASAVESIDQSSTDIVGLLADPHTKIIKTRGLVVGHVQSGKTANFTATIAKAADSGYRMFIVLSGVHNALRRQTQLRLERQLTDLEPKRWLPLTDEHHDFGNPVRALAIMASTDLRLLAVVKKNVSRLTRLRDWLRQAAEHGGLDTCPVLIIDDEADQASPNAARNPELDRTKINQRIVELLELPRVAYVGYTATPFANVLIDPQSPEDLYPRSFIYALAKPSTYFGAEELFGLGLTGEEEADAHDMIRIVPESEAELHRVRSGQPFHAEVTPSLRQAIVWFLLATAARRIRTGKTPHSSMLIHTTQRVLPHLEYLEPIRMTAKEIAAAMDRRDPDVLAELRALWEQEQTREPSDAHGLPSHTFDEIAFEVLRVIGDLKVVADNGQSAERLLYDDEAGTTVIAVGGNTLSRGLTLEGLVSSFFLRGANAYDTLLQMGRWFGYRPGYGDLPRIWTTKELADGFRFLADVENDLRSEVDRYRVEQTNPSQVAVRLMLHPKLQVTNKVRMQFAVATQASFSGQRPQTIYFAHRNEVAIAKNLEAAKEVIARGRASGSSDVADAKVILRDLAVGDILSFIESYQWDQNADLDPVLLRKYIERQNEAGLLTTWNLGVMTRETDTNGTIDLGLDLPVNLIQRSRLKQHSTPSTANIGTLMSKPDRVADLMDASAAAGLNEADLVEERTSSGRGLLLLYPIASNSQPRPSARNREPLDAADDLIGVALAFPRAPRETDPSSRIAVDLSRIKSPAPEEEEGPPDEEYQDQDGDRDDLDLGDRVG